MTKRDNIFENLFSEIEKRFFEKRYFIKNLFSLLREEILKMISRDGFLGRDLAISLKIDSHFSKNIFEHSDYKWRFVRHFYKP